MGVVFQRKMLEQELHKAIEQAQKQFQNRIELKTGKSDHEPTH